MGREIGRIVEVRGTSVKAELFELLPPYLIKNSEVAVAPRINTYVKTRVGLDTVVCQITGEYFDELKKGSGQFTGYFLDLSVKGYFDGSKFIQGMRLLPMVAATVELLDRDEFKQINDCEENGGFKLGNDLFDITQDYYLSYNSIIPSHIGIFGNTGSGKSNTLARLLHEYAKVLVHQDNGKLLIIDLNDEYGGNAVCGGKFKKIYKLSTRVADNGDDKIPIDFDSLTEDQWCILLNATEATQRPVVKTACNKDKTDEEYENTIKWMLKTGQYQLFRSLQYHLRDYVSGIEDIYWHSKSQVFYYKTANGDPIYADMDSFETRVLNNIKVRIPDDKLDAFLFRLYFATAVHIGYGTQYDYISPLLRRAEKLIMDFHKVFIDSKNDLFGDKNIAVIQLANVNQDMTELIPSILTNRLFLRQVEVKKERGIKSIVNIAIDEAHNLLFEDDNDFRHKNITIDVFEKAIKEGRKFGLYLWIASQRPSDISSTIISQLHNYFIHKLINPNDLNRIRKAVAFLDENSMNSLTVLGPGECIVSGTGVNMPCFVKVDQLEPRRRPNSENVVLFGENGIFEKVKPEAVLRERKKITRIR